MNTATADATWTQWEKEGLSQLLEVLPGRVRQKFLQYPQTSEISLLLGRPLALSDGSWSRPLIFPDIVVQEADLDYVVSKLSGIKADGRAGINGTAHRIAVIYDRMRQIIGLTVRVARYLEVMDSETARTILESRGSVLIIGAPGSGKTTLLRNLVALLSQEIGPHLSVIDTSNEIGGLGQIPHPALGVARWHQVPHPKDQAEIIRRVIANHGPLVLVLDEVGYNEDVEEVEAAARRGIQVVASVHGKTLLDVLENPIYRPFLGYPDRRGMRRQNRPSFRAAIEVRGKGKLFVIPDLAQAVDDLLLGNPPRGLRLGPGWDQGEPEYLPGELGEPPLRKVAQAYLERNPSLATAALNLGLNAQQVAKVLLRATLGDEEALEAVHRLGQGLQG